MIAPERGGTRFKRFGVLVELVDSEALDEFLLRASQSGMADECKALLARGANPDAATKTPRLEALYLAASIAGSVETVQVLLAAGASVDGPVDGGSTPLHGAARSGQLAVARTLIEAGADIDREAAGMPLTPTGIAEYWSLLGQGQTEVAAYLRSLGGQNPYNDPNRPEDLWSGREGELHLRFVERALGARVPFPFEREPVKGRRLALYWCRFRRPHYYFRLLFTVQLSLTAEREVGLVLPCSWPVHRAALELPRFTWPLDLLFGVAARLDRGEVSVEHGDVLDREHPAVRGLAWPTSFEQWLVVRHGSFETVRQELSTEDDFIAKWLRPTLLLVPHFAKRRLRAGAEALAKADAKARVKWEKPALGTARNGLVVPTVARAEGVELRATPLDQ